MEYFLLIPVLYALAKLAGWAKRGAAANNAERKAIEATADLLDARRALFKYAVEHKCKVSLAYLDANGRRTTRVVEPFFADDKRVEGFCGSRKDLRHFTYDRMIAVKILDDSKGGQN